MSAARYAVLNTAQTFLSGIKANIRFTVPLSFSGSLYGHFLRPIGSLSFFVSSVAKLHFPLAFSGILSLVLTHHLGNVRGQCNLWGLRGAFRAGIKIKGGGRKDFAKSFLYFLTGNFFAYAYLRRCSNSKLITPTVKQLKKNLGFIPTVNLLKQE